MFNNISFDKFLSFINLFIKISKSLKFLNIILYSRFPQIFLASICLLCKSNPPASIIPFDLEYKDELPSVDPKSRQILPL